MRVLIAIDIPSTGTALLKQEGLQLTQWTGQDPMDPASLRTACLEHDILLSSSVHRLDADFLKANSHLKLISQYAAGVDNIDLQQAKALGIRVANTPDAMTEATADIAFALLLAVARKLCFMHKKILQDDWGPFRPKAHLGRELKGKTLGVVGLGRIGAAFAHRCRAAYGMKILYHNRSRNLQAEETLDATYVSFSELLETSDIVSVHASLNENTRGLFNREAFSRMRPEAIFLNTSRGGVHNEPDLINALQQGQIWGAGLDVTNPEPMKPDNPLLRMENVAVTPHIGSATLEARNEMSFQAARNILQFVRGETLTNLVL